MTITTRGTGAPVKNVSTSQEAIVLSGPPHMLTGNLILQNRAGEKLFVRDLPLRPSKARKKGAKAAPLGDHLLVRARLAPDESKSHPLQVTLDAQTPPGVYEASVSIGKTEVPVRLSVHPFIEVSLAPDSLYLVGLEAGRTHEADVLLVNEGNVPVEVPPLRHGTATDMDLVCRNLVQAIRENGKEGSQAVLDAFVRGVTADIAGWIELTIKEAATVVDPGASILMHMTFKLPEDVKMERAYEGEIRIYDELLSYVIVGEPGARKKGKSATR